MRRIRDAFDVYDWRADGEGESVTYQLDRREAAGQC
jgi:hypothetical protein